MYSMSQNIEFLSHFRFRLHELSDPLFSGETISSLSLDWIWETGLESEISNSGSYNTRGYVFSVCVYKIWGCLRLHLGYLELAHPLVI